MDRSKSLKAKDKPCRECIRLKLRCTRGPWPCSKCVERGVASLCPFQQLPTRPYKKHRSEGANSSSSTATETESSTQLQQQIPFKEDASSKDATNIEEKKKLASHRILERPSSSNALSDVKGKRKAKKPASESDQQYTQTDQAKSIEDEDRGMLVFERNGNRAYYGPHSHSFHLVQSASSDSPFSYNVGTYGVSSIPQTLSMNSTSEGMVANWSSSQDDIFLMNEREEPALENMVDKPLSCVAIPGFTSPFDNHNLIAKLSQHLPSRTIAERYFAIFEQNVCWLYKPVSSVEALWNDIYGSASDHVADGNLPYSYNHTAGMLSSIHPHRFALTFSILCLGALFDVGPNRDRSLLDQLADTYYQRAWVALQCTNLIENSTIDQVQTIHLLGHYFCNRQNGRMANSYFPIIGLAMRSAISLGLHREPQAWNLPNHEVEGWRQLFWELYAVDTFRSLACGRPCNIQDCHIDTLFPSGSLDHNLTHTFHTIKYKTVRILNQFLDHSQRSNVSYNTILEFDKSLRQLWALLPTSFRSLPMSQQAGARINIDQFATVSKTNNVEQKRGVEQMQLFLQGQTAVVNISQSLLHLHRPWFVRALRQSKETGKDVMESPFARSVVAISESSRSIILAAQNVLEMTPTLGLAWNYFWQHCFNAGICQCLQILHNPSSVTTLGAWDDVRRSLLILGKARPDKTDVVWAGKLELLDALQKKAEAAMFGHRPSDGHAHLSLVGATSSFDQSWMAGGTNQDLSRYLSNDERSTDQDLKVYTGYNQENHMMHQPNVDMNNTSSQDWLLSLSDSLADSLLTQGRPDQSTLQEPTRIVNKEHTQYPSRVPSQQLQSSLSHTSNKNQDGPSRNLTTDPAKIPVWNNLLADLLQVGSDPDVNFWQTLTQSHK